ncbi:bifunctional DNA primase/polymerase [Leucobacter sp. gxy201]|uniref:bifunctional DNA primase/polymerase n=1 Tax=Leucobacter sp. gxy201 TaxID=2957200 RepID=UPI003DA113D9
MEVSENACQRTLPKPTQQRCRTFWKTPFTSRTAAATSRKKEGVVFVSHHEVTVWPLPRNLPGTLTDAAAAYAAAGLPVFPCVPGAKHPLTTHGYRDASTDLARVRRWWWRTPEANIGIATGTGFDVLDVDVHAIGTGFKVLRTLQREDFIGGWGQAVRSPSGGVHFYYPSDPDREQRSWSRGTSHMDFRGVGGYIIAPPSRIATGHGLRRYEVIAHGRTPRLFDADAIRALLTPPPPALPRPVVFPRSVESVGRLANWVSRLPEGNRNSGLFWAACRLAEAGLTEPELRGVLEPAAAATALETREIVATIRSAYRTAQLAYRPADAIPDTPGALTGLSR